MMCSHRRNQAKRRGATVVEFAMVSAVLILLMFGILEYCLITYTQNVVENAAREGCRYGVVNVTDSTMIADTQKVTQNFMCGLDTKMTGYSCTVYKSDSKGNNIGAATDAQFGEYVCVSVSLNYVPVTPGLLFLKSFTISSKAAMISEAN